MGVTLVRGDIVEQDVDAIVNAANTALAGGSGVCGAIFAAAGRTEMARACAAVAPCPTGEARSTPGFGLLARWVVHAVGPIWENGGAGEEDLLRSAYRSALGEGARIGATSMAFPVLSTGIYGYPLQEGCEVAVDVLVGEAPSSIADVRIVAFDDRTAAVLEALLPR